MVRCHDFHNANTNLSLNRQKYMSSWVLRAFDLFSAFLSLLFPALHSCSFQSAGSTNVYHPMVSDPFSARQGTSGRLVALSTAPRLLSLGTFWECPGDDQIIAPDTKKKEQPSESLEIRLSFCVLAFMMIHVDSFWFQDVGSRMSRHHNNLLALL